MHKEFLHADATRLGIPPERPHSCIGVGCAETSDMGAVGSGLMQKLKLLAQNGWPRIRCDPSDVAAWVR